MPLLIALLVIFFAVVLIVFPLWAFLQIRRARDELTDAQRRIDRLETAVGEQRSAAARVEPAVAAAPMTAPGVSPSVSSAAPASPPSAYASAQEQSQGQTQSGAAVPGFPPTPPVSAAPAATPRPAMPPPLPSQQIPAPPQPPPLFPRPASVPPRPPTEGERAPVGGAPRGAINWEQFMGVKLFAWLGGLAAFLAIAFFVKWSFDHDLIPPAVRAGVAFLASFGLIGGGLLLSRKRYAVTSHTLCASGVVGLYAVTFACREVYAFPLFTSLATFGAMAAITAGAFLLAVRMDAKVVAVLGILGGFLTPRLLATGHDNPPGLFGYLALLDIGLLAVALRKRWHFLVPLGALGTAVMQVGWAGKFLTYDKTLTAMIVCVGFEALFLAGFVVARRFGQASRALSLSVVGLATVAFGFATYFALRTGTGHQPARLFSFLLLTDLGVLALAALDAKSAKAHLGAGLATFALLAAWTMARLDNAMLSWALGAYFVFAVLHAAFPLLLERLRPEAKGDGWLGQLFPPLALLLVLGPVLNSPTASEWIWPAVLLIDLVAIALAAATGMIAAVVAALVLTLLAATVWMFKLPIGPETASPVFPLLVVIAGFAVVFFGAGLWLMRRLAAAGGKSGDAAGARGAANAHLPAMAALMPFALLFLATARVPMSDPAPVFGVALLLTALTLGLTRWLAFEWLPMCALGGVLAVTYAWHGRHFQTDAAVPALAWYVGFHAVFTGFPFLFRRTLLDTRRPWLASALAGVGVFPLVLSLIDRTWPNDVRGLVPALFALPPLAGLLAVWRLDPPEHPRRMGRLAMFGGIALLFVTLVFPVQFKREWVTLGWALEGAALLWLFRRVPHRGLPIAGVVLLGLAFVRLALNDAVFSYRPRGDVPIWNWYLYTYGIAAACFFVGARLLAPPRERTMGFNAPPWLNALGLVLTFLLLNLEITDYFSAPGEYHRLFEFHGNFARDMAYTVGWSLFAFGLLVLGIWARSRWARYAALGLLGVAVAKLFFHDLANLGQLYRVGALLAVAVIAILASFVYQRFLPAEKRS